MRHGWLVGGAAMLFVASCSGSDAPSATAPTPGTDASTTVEVESTETSAEVQETTTTPAPVEETTTTAAPTTEPEPTTTIDGGPFLKDVPGKIVESAPGVNSAGEIWELIPNVWFFVPSELDPNDPNVFIAEPEDAEVLAAYARHLHANYSDFVQNPALLEPSGAFKATVTAEGLAELERGYREAAEIGQHFKLFGGDLIRPNVVDEPRTDTEVFILDCEIAQSKWVYNADGSRVDPNLPDVEISPILAQMVKEDDGVWRLNSLTIDARACL